MNRDKRAAQPTTRHQSENFQRDSRCTGDRVRQDDVWRNYSGKDNSNSNENMDCSKYNNKKSYNSNNNNDSKPYRGSNGYVSDHRYDNRHLFPPREPRNASRQFQEQQPQPRSKRGDIWGPKSDDGRSCDNNNDSKPYRGSNGYVSDHRYDNRHLFPPREPRNASRQFQEQQPQPRSKRGDIWGPKSDDGRSCDNNNDSKPYRGSNGYVSDHRYDNRHLFPPREPRNASRQFQEQQQQPQPRSKRGDIWRPKSDDGRTYDNNSYNSRPYRGSNGCVSDYRHDNRHLQPQPRSKRSDLWRPKSADERHGQRQEWALKQEQNLGPGKKEGVQQGGRQVAQALLPHWVRMKDMMWMSALRKNDTKEVSTTTEAGMTASKHKKPSDPPPKPVTTLAARVISRDGPFGPSSTIELVPAMGSNGGTPLGSCCVNLVFESFGMIGITPNQENPAAYDIKRTDNYQLTAEQKLRLRNAIERSEDGQVLASLDVAIQEIRTEIDQKSPLMLEMSPDRSPRHSPGRQEVKPQQLQQEQKEAAVFDPAVWTWRTPTPTSPVSEGNDSDLDSWDKTRTFATKSNITSCAEGGRKSWKSSSDAGDRSEFDFPGTRSSTTDFSQPPFGRKKM
ncbi:putative mediator of RNA polymerase II transcription subunit 26 [Drosophila madeirensis]|uniref:Mediator of RNA polymerase II transcription subunit 26 n=1 Tax=Drosophila madeirensis TaxID=30013 RepID=A0AAU9G3L2_DROMD